MRKYSINSTYTICRYVFLMFISFIALVCLQSCRTKERPKSDNSTITTLVPGADITRLGPHNNSWQRFLLYLPLVAYDENGVLKPKLAERWEHSPDYLTWTIHLRKDVKWHDGMPVTAYDIEFTLDLFNTPGILWYRPKGNITILDDYSYSVVLEKPANPLSWWKVYYPKHLLEDIDPEDFYDCEFWRHPVGNGPYRYVRHVPKTMVELEANPDYFTGEPRIKKAVLRFGGSIPLVELLSGNVDIIESGYSDILKINNDPRFRAYYSRGIEGDNQIAIFWNHRLSFFQNPKVRRALTMAINRRELLKVINLPDNLPISDVLYSRRQERRGEILDPVPYDPEQAANLLDEAGWRIKEGETVRKRRGEKFSFSALVFIHPRLTGTAAIYVQENLRRIGVEMEIQTLDAGPGRERMRKGDFQAGFWRLNLAYFLNRMSHMGYNNPNINQLYKILPSGMREPLLEQLDRICYELMPIFANDIPVTSLFPEIGLQIAHRRIKGLKSPYFTNPYYAMEHLWIEEEK